MTGDYEFNHQDAPYHFPQMPGYKPLATHTIDIQFLFTGYHGGQLGVNIDQTTGQPREINALETKLSDQLVAAGNAPWPKYSASAPKLYSQNVPSSSAISEAQYSADHKCDYWYPSLGF